MDISQLPVIASREFMGGRVVALEDGGSSAVVAFTPPQGMANPHGTVQGGFVAAMIDDVVSMATWFAGRERSFVTSSLNCFYLRPVPSGIVVQVKASLVQAGKRQAVFDAEVTADGDPKILVRAVQTQQFIES